jgi:hypothetical protein
VLDTICYFDKIILHLNGNNFKIIFTKKTAGFLLPDSFSICVADHQGPEA